MPDESTLTLFIPDLFGFQSTLSQLSSEELTQLPEINLPVLEKWLSRGLFEANTEQDDLVFSELGLDDYKNKDKPFAAFSLLAEKCDGVEIDKQSFWLRADPVNLQADRDTALLVAHEELSLSQDEADKLAELINEHFVDEPWQLYSFAPHRWYLCLAKEANLKTTALEKVLGDDINQHRSTGDDADYWSKITNELQMLLHGSNVNFERDSRNQLTANSIWLWGGGFFPENNLNSNYDKIITNNLVFSGVGYHCGFDVLSLDNINDKILQNNNFIVLDMLSEHVQRRDLYTFVNSLNEIENTYLALFNDLLLNGKLTQIKILTDKGIFTVSKKRLRRWWKRTKHFSGFNYA